MKVAFISYEYGYGRMYGEDVPYLYGIGRYSSNLVERLRRLGVDLDVFTVNKYVKNIGIMLFKIKNVFKNFNEYDIVHSNEAGAAFVRHRNKIETFHHDYTSQGLRYLLYSLAGRMAIRGAKHIIVPSYTSKQAIMNFDGAVPDDRVSVIHHGVDKQIFKNSEDDKKLATSFRSQHGLTDSFVIISVGRLEPHKRQRDIVKALAGLKGFALILVGQGREKRSLINLARQKNVRLLHFNFVSDKKLAVLYNSADVYVHASTLEGFGLTVLEAMSCGLPVIAYNTADFEYIVDHGGYLLKKGDVSGLRNAVMYLKENYAERKLLGGEAEKKSNLFTWERSAQEHLKVYMEVLCSNAS